MYTCKLEIIIHNYSFITTVYSPKKVERIGPKLTQIITKLFHF